MAAGWRGLEDVPVPLAQSGFGFVEAAPLAWKDPFFLLLGGLVNKGVLPDPPRVLQMPRSLHGSPSFVNVRLDVLLLVCVYFQLILI